MNYLTIFILFQSLLISIKVFISQEIYTLTDEPVDMKTCQALADYAHYLFTNVLIKFWKPQARLEYDGFLYSSED